jgi:hypothetical protein
MTTTTLDKAALLLVSGRLDILLDEPDEMRARCGRMAVRWSRARGYSCSCRSWGTCSHVAALQLFRGASCESF